jgi:hypothetical protein
MSFTHHLMGGWHGTLVPFITHFSGVFGGYSRTGVVIFPYFFDEPLFENTWRTRPASI